MQTQFLSLHQSKNMFDFSWQDSSWLFERAIWACPLQINQTWQENFGPKRKELIKSGTYPTATFLFFKAKCHQQMDLPTNWLMDLVTLHKKELSFLKLRLLKQGRIQCYPGCVQMGRSNDRETTEAITFWALTAVSSWSLKCRKSQGV